MTGIYLTRAALDQVDGAQAELERHLVTGFDGRCATCRQPEPCPGRTAAAATFVRYGRLPRRRPGLASIAPPEATNWAWFASAAGRQ
ncbi:hypothetical protein [Plantactinospora sp. GCM10030261]|uniref:hypothetical protein n=1 Tax=Plantactinospora sp. GCM10030261 TaxID=3273420 RepID=UPI003620F8F7